MGKLRGIVRRNVLCVVALMAPVAFGGSPVFTDLWDVAQGSVVTNSSLLIGSSSASNMFGDSSSPPEQDRTIFFDGFGAGYIHWVEWSTPGMIVLDSYSLYAADDNASNPGDRGFTEFRLFARASLTDPFVLINTFNPASNPYPGNSVAVNISLPVAVTAQYFRAEFVQFAADHFPGPRVIELDGFGTIVGPCSADLTGDGVLNFFDVSAFLSAFSASDLVADFTGDGVLNFFDVSAFLQAFTAGCP